MSTTNTVSSLNGLFKKVYTDAGLQKIHPNIVKVFEEIEFVKDAKMGGFDYNVPIVLAHEHGK